jgi:aldehyde dehydrogenase (NAD+)
MIGLDNPRRKTVAAGQLLIDGQWRDAASGETTTTSDPTTEEVITTIAKASAEEAGEAVEAARRAFEDGPWGRMHHEERAKLLFRVADLLDERADDFAVREAMDMGIPYHDFRDTIMPFCSGLFRFHGGLAMSALDGSYRTSYESDIRILTRREPLGVVAAITPFNFPLTLSVSKIAPALAAGNTVVHKPASDTPLTALALGRVMLDAGLPDGAYNLITGGGGTIGDALVRDPERSASPARGCWSSAPATTRWSRNSAEWHRRRCSAIRSIPRPRSVRSPHAPSTTRCSATWNRASRPRA